MSEIQKKEQELISFIEEKLPDFAELVKTATADGTAEETKITLHQDAFAADYDDDEYILLGKAIKYAGLYNVIINIIGKSRGTLVNPADN